MKVLFVCVGNSARSQMAEAFARAAGLDARSAGTHPAPEVHPLAVAAMAEVGIPLLAHGPKLLDVEGLDGFDRTITMGCGVQETCPALHTDEDWGLDDPATGTIEDFRRIRDQVRDHVARLAAAARER